MYTKTDNGATQYEHSGNNAVEFFSKAGSMYVTKKKPNAGTPIELFKALWRSGDNLTSMKLLFWLRDPRGGAGNRSGFRACLKWLVDENPEWVISNIHLIPEHGRWDDLRYLFGTEAEAVVANFWGNKIAEKDFLASKWVRVNGKNFDLPLMKALKKSRVISNDKGAFRKLVVNNRDSIVEKKMCSKEWKGINFSHVPSRAMSMFTKAFERNAPTQFETWKEALVKGDPKVKVNASVLMPHDLVKNMKGMGNRDVANAQFEALPNYMKDTDLRILPLCDTSGSMCSVIGESKNVRAIDVSMALGLYCSDKIGKGNPFYRNFMEFETESTLHNWVDMKPSDALGLFRGKIGSTNIVKALDTILSHAKMFNATDEQIPNCLLIISDMQFNSSGGYSWGSGSKSSGPEVTTAIDKWVEAGYSRPKVIYWNTCGKDGSPEKSTSKDVGLVSGFSPSILGSIMGGTDFTPIGIMKEAIKKYNVVIPE
jgi:hypothetical protein